MSAKRGTARQERLGAAGTARALDMGPETRARLEAYAELLARWQQRINLVATASLDDLWRRHMLDSGQLLRHLPQGRCQGPGRDPSQNQGRDPSQSQGQDLGPGQSQGQGACRLVDLGSGAGFPGLVLAILGAGEVHLVESDQRKAAFLREAARVTETDVTVHAARIEAVAPFDADVVTARALAPLPRLLGWAHRFWGPATVGLFLKGRAADDELTAAAKKWMMGVSRLPSITDPEGVIVRVEALRPIEL